ncbi:TPA: hypothetical protein HA243_02025, partial [Candidatus Micrarchaeota archaeon]|nr:hypothetical protein [Candidatus Micrarchaeota archaeon]
MATMGNRAFFISMAFFLALMCAGAYAGGNPQVFPSDCSSLDSNTDYVLTSDITNADSTCFTAD